MKMSRSEFVVLFVLFAIFGSAIVLWAQPNTAPNWPYAGASGDVQRRLEYDANGDHNAVNLKLQSGTPTPGNKLGRCSLACFGATPAIQQSVNGGAYAPIGSGGGSDCECSGAGSNSVRVGVGAAAAGSDSVAIGVNSSAGNAGTCVGFDCDASTLGTCVSSDPTGCGINVSCLGYGVNCTTQDSVCLGSQCSPAGGICFGPGCVSTANRFVAGVQNNAMSSVYFGEGYQDTSPTAYTISGTNGQGSNVAGASIALQGGAGTGSGTGGNVVFRRCPSGSSGSSLNGCATAWSMRGQTGNLAAGDDFAIVLGDADEGSISFSGAFNSLTIADPHYTIGGATWSLFNAWTNSTILDQAVNSIIIQNSDYTVDVDGGFLVGLALIGTGTFETDNVGSFLFLNGGTFQNALAENRTFGSYQTFADTSTFLCRGGRTCTGGNVGHFISAPTFSTSGGGASLAFGALVGFGSSATLDSGSSINGRQGFLCDTVSGGTNTGLNVCLDIKKQTSRGTDTYGISNADTTIYPPTASAVTAVGSTISQNQTVTRLTNATGGNITLTSAPTIANPASASTDGKVLIIFNGGPDPVTLQDQGTLANSNLQLNASTVQLGVGDALTLYWDNTLGDWYQLTPLSNN